MMKKTLGLAGVLLATSLSGCATTPTPYQPLVGGQRVSGGYSDIRLSEDRYRVHFAGNSFTSRDRVEGYLLYRAAELSLQNGYDSFVIVDRFTEHDVQTYAEPDPFYRPWYGSRYGFWRPHWRYLQRGQGWGTWYPGGGRPFWADRMNVQTIESFEAEAEIQLLRGPAPAGERRAFDAREVIRDLEPTIQRPQP